MADRKHGGISDTMIHLIIGTKAQAIKMAPVIRHLKQKGIRHNLIDLGQHSLITKALREEFDVDEPGVYLSQGNNVSTIQQAFVWLASIFFKSLSTSWIQKEVFLSQGGICLIHGDTVSTLIGLYLAKRARIKVAHIEAGLRSFNLLNPFPEEIIRLVTMRFSDILFAPCKWAFSNLTSLGLKERSILISANTSLESTFYSLNKNIDPGLGLGHFALVTAHRMENIFSRKKMKFIVEAVHAISRRLPVVFVQHQPTLYQLKKFRLEDSLKETQRIRFLRILSHAHFINLLNRCEFVVTDGGSIQEESFYLGKPCLLLRRCTERKEGIGENAVLSSFERGKIDYFIEHYVDFKRAALLPKEPFASSEIVDRLTAYE